MINKEVRNILSQGLSDLSAIHLEPTLLNESGVNSLYSDETWSFNNGYELEVTFVAKTINDLEYIAHIRFKRPNQEEIINDYSSLSLEAENDLKYILDEIALYNIEEVI